MRSILNIILILSILILHPLCRGTGVRTGNVPLKFIITGNTGPESPFTGFTESLPRLIDAINRENPDFVIHSGNMIHGGYRWMGIKENDLDRQFRLFLSAASKLLSPLYTLPGTKDLLDDSPELYVQHTGRNTHYSFNFGSIHIVMLNTSSLKSGAGKSDEEIKWLKNDLKSNRDKKEIFVFTHTPIFDFKKGNDNFKKAGEIHEVLKGYPVFAVFSGDEPGHYEFTRDSIRYIHTGCGGFDNLNKNNYFWHFYIAAFDGNNLKISPRRLPLTR